MHCSFINNVWQLLRGWLSLPALWKGKDLAECMRHWFALFRNGNTLPLFLFDAIWRAQNASIFKDSAPSVYFTSLKTIYQWNSYPSATLRPKLRRVLVPVIDDKSSHGFFDGASQRDVCGAGIVLYIHHNHHFNIQVGIGVGDGLKPELLALRCLLWFSLRRGFSTLNIFGDSQVVVNWFNGRHKIKALILEPWMEEVMRLRASFDSIYCQHIYREANSAADHLSKLTLGPMDGSLNFSEVRDGIIVDQGSIPTF